MKLSKRPKNTREYVGSRRNKSESAALKHSKARKKRKSGAEKTARDNVRDFKVKYKPAKDKRSSGATRSESSPQGKPIKWGRIIVLPLLIVSLSVGISKVDWQSVYDKAYSATNRPLTSVKIESEFRYVSKEELKNTISKKLDGSFVDLDLRDLKSSVEQNPWIQAARIERIWPDTLKLEIVEYTPIARWGNDGFISREGELIRVISNEALAHLPLLSGNDSDSQEVANNYLLFSELLKGSELQISGLELDEKLAWTISLAQDFVLVLGRGDIHSRLENFRYVYENYLKNENDRLARVDMRYEKGLAVSWKDDNTVDEKIVATRSTR